MQRIYYFCLTIFIFIKFQLNTKINDKTNISKLYFKKASKLNKVQTDKVIQDDLKILNIQQDLQLFQTVLAQTKNSKKKSSIKRIKNNLSKVHSYFRHLCKYDSKFCKKIFLSLNTFLEFEPQNTKKQLQNVQNKIKKFANNITKQALIELNIKNNKVSKEMYRLSRQAALQEFLNSYNKINKIDQIEDIFIRFQEQIQEAAQNQIKIFYKKFFN